MDFIVQLEAGCDNFLFSWLPGQASLATNRVLAGRQHSFNFHQALKLILTL